MTAIQRLFRLVAVLSFLVFLQSCCTSPYHFSGKVLNKNGDAIKDAVVKVGKREASTSADGAFKICVDRAERYMLDVSNPRFGSVSKVYTDTASNIIITLSRATVVTVDPNRDIVVEDVNPDVSTPAGTSATPTTPLDTIPFVYDALGRLVGFTMPPELKATAEGVSQFQQPQRGARISIPARSLVMEGTQRYAEDSVEVSVNTIDLYSPDGMPGDNTVDLGGGKRGYMVSYGATNIEASLDGKALQLGEGKTATLTIPIDTLSILSKAEIPDDIPFLTYNKTTGLWEQNGTAKLNPERTAYTKTVNHFSTFNLDMVWSGQSCIQLCDGISPAASGTTNALDITVPGKTKRMIIPGTAPCAAGTTDCGVYGINGPATHAIINLQNNIPVTVQVYKNASATGSGGTLQGTYVFNSGPAPSGSPSTYQNCLYNDCAGPFRISDTGACYEKTAPVDGSMLVPVMTFQLVGTNVEFDWIFIESISSTTGQVSNTPLFYEIEFQTYGPGEAFDAAKAWTAVDFNPALAQTFSYPPNDMPGTSEWHNRLTVAFNAGATNPQLTATDIILFRVNHSTTGQPGTFTTPGVVRVINLPMPGDPFTTAFNATYPCNIPSN